MTIRLVNLLTELVVAAAALVISAGLLPGVSLSPRGLVVAVAIMELPFLSGYTARIVARRALSGVLGAFFFAWALVGLPVAEILTPGLDIDGVGSWIGALIVVWVLRAAETWLGWNDWARVRRWKR